MPKLTTITRSSEAKSPDRPVEFPRQRICVVLEFPPGRTSALARLTGRWGLLRFIKRWFDVRIVELRQERVVDASEWQSTGR